MGDNGSGTAIAVRVDERVDVSPFAGNGEAFNTAQRVARSLAASNILPASYHGNLPNVLVVMEYAHRLGCSVLAVAQNLDVIHGRPSLRATFLIGTVNACGRFTPIRFRFQGQEGTDTWGCRAVAKDRETGEECIGPLVTIAMAKAEGWYNKAGSKWKTIPELMLMYRSAGWWTRVFSPELSLGLHTTDETEDIYAGPAMPDRAQTIAAALSAGDAVEEGQAEVVGTSAPAEQDDGSPATAAQITLVKELRQKARDADLLGVDDEEALESAILNKAGPDVRHWIRSLSKDLIVPGNAQAELLGKEG